MGIISQNNINENGLKIFVRVLGTSSYFRNFLGIFLAWEILFLSSRVHFLGGHTKGRQLSVCTSGVCMTRGVCVAAAQVADRWAIPISFP